MDSGLPDFMAACFQCPGASRFQAFIASKCIKNHVEAAMGFKHVNFCLIFKIELSFSLDLLCRHTEPYLFQCVGASCFNAFFVFECDRRGELAIGV